MLLKTKKSDIRNRSFLFAISLFQPVLQFVQYELSRVSVAVYLREIPRNEAQIG